MEKTNTIVSSPSSSSSNKKRKDESTYNNHKITDFFRESPGISTMGRPVGPGEYLRKSNSKLPLLRRTNTTIATTITNTMKNNTKKEKKQGTLRYIKVRWPVKKDTNKVWENWLFAATTTTIKDENKWKVVFKGNSKRYNVQRDVIWDITKNEYDEFNVLGKEEDVSYMANETDKKKVKDLQKTWCHENKITENALNLLNDINKAFNHGLINKEWQVANVCIN